MQNPDPSIDSPFVPIFNVLFLLPSQKQFSIFISGALSILPTILFLATEILRLSKASPTLADAGILLLERAAECKAARVQEDTKVAHAQLLQSTLASLVERVKSGK